MPADGIGAVTEEVAELECLPYLLEEHLDVPVDEVEVAHAAGAPSGVGGDEDHQTQFVIDLDPGFNPVQRPTFEAFELVAGELNDLVLDHVAALLHRQVAQGTVFEASTFSLSISQGIMHAGWQNN